MDASGMMDADGNDKRLIGGTLLKAGTRLARLSSTAVCPKLESLWRCPWKRPVGSKKSDDDEQVMAARRQSLARVAIIL